ncbi:hypothetical protein O5D80_008635 [Batrachochytrium dendrobatidis]|nr:hypothetical protein O5D80_008635 [Batrachochytrium dendrobatidis]
MASVGRGILDRLNYIKDLACGPPPFLLKEIINLVGPFGSSGLLEIIYSDPEYHESY